jgi:hypothetical protein
MFLYVALDSSSMDCTNSNIKVLMVPFDVIYILWVWIELDIPEFTTLAHIAHRLKYITYNIAFEINIQL